MYLKNVFLLTSTFVFLTLVLRAVVNSLLYRAGYARLPLTIATVATIVVSGLLVPMAAQALLELMRPHVSLIAARIVSAGLMGALLGAVVGAHPYYRRDWAMVWGLLGGVGAALVYQTFGDVQTGQLILPAVIALALPHLALDLPGAHFEKPFRAGGRIVPIRGRLPR